MNRFRFLLVFFAVAVGASALAAVAAASLGWTVTSAGWALLVPFVMWAPALARFVAQRTVDRGFAGALPVRKWGATGAQVVVWPAVVPLGVYGAAYALAWTAGFAHWNPGGGKWTSGAQIAANVAINLVLLGIMGTFTALGEELGWRGYLQPRLDAAGVRASVLVVWLVELAYHAPLMLGAGYVNTGNLFVSIALFAVGDLTLTFVWARESYRAGSLWPAVFFHSFHNTVSQWLYPKFFAGGEDELRLGEMGMLPVLCYSVLGVAVFLWTRRRGPSWSDLARLRTSR